MPPINPQALARMFQGQQNPLYPNQPAPDPSQPTPPPTSAPPQPPSPAPTPQPSATPAPQPGQIAEQMNPAMPGRPRGDFDKIPDGQPGADSWSNRHNVLRHALASLFAGAAEFGGDINHHPGAAAPFVNRWQGQTDEQRQYDQNLPAMRQTASLNLQEKLANIGKEQRTGQYVTPRSGGVFDVTKGQYAPGAEPPDKPEQPHTVETGNGVFQFNPQTKRYDIPVGPAKASQKPDSPEQQFMDEYQRTHQGATVADALKAYGQTTQKPEHEPKQMVVGPDGTVIELHPGMKVPAGSKTTAKYGEPTADEQRRADLSKNLNENFTQLEDIVNRRPELFGPLAGRWTELKGKFGSDDPDVAALQTLEHQIGMAQISAHGMRSAQGIEGASRSILNGFHSGPNAIKSAIATARKSVGTFQGDVDEAKGNQPQSKAPAKSKTSANDPLGIR